MRVCKGTRVNISIFNDIIRVIPILILFISFPNSVPRASTLSNLGKPLKIIFEGDFASDVEDLGTLAMLHALSHQGRIKILGIICSTNNAWSAIGISALNQYLGNPIIPLGLLKKEKFSGDSKFRSGYTFNRYLASHFSHPYASLQTIPEATSLLRKILVDPQNEEILYISSGNLMNLESLLHSGPDHISSLTGYQLIQKKIHLLTITSGAYPKNDQDYHFISSTEASKTVSMNWPGSILYIGHEWDGIYTTGPTLIKLCKKNNPVLQSYLLWDKNYFPRFEPGYTGSYVHPHPSRAQIALYYSLMEGSPNFSLSPIGGNYINSEGANYWVKENGRKDHYLMPKSKTKGIASQIEKWMAYCPNK